MIDVIRKNLKGIGIFLVFAIFGFMALTFAAIPASADLSDTACEGFEAALGSSGCSPAGGDQINSTLETVIDLMSIIVAVISVIMIIIGGFRYVTSQGDPGSTKGARDTIIYALIGLAIVAVAQSIVKFVVKAISEPSTG